MFCRIKKPHPEDTCRKKFSRYRSFLSPQPPVLHARSSSPLKMSSNAKSIKDFLKRKAAPPKRLSVSNFPPNCGQHAPRAWLGYAFILAVFSDAGGGVESLLPLPNAAGLVARARNNPQHPHLPTRTAPNLLTCTNTPFGHQDAASPLYKRQEPAAAPRAPPRQNPPRQNPPYRW